MTMIHSKHCDFSSYTLAPTSRRWSFLLLEESRCIVTSGETLLASVDAVAELLPKTQVRQDLGNESRR